MKTPDTLPELELMRDGVDYRFAVSCRKGRFDLRPLTALEIVQVAQDVADEMEKMPEAHRLGVTQSLKMAIKTIERASTPDPDTFVPKLTALTLSRMTPDEIDFLHKQYVAGTNKVNPSLEMMPLAEVEALVEEVKKSPRIDLALIDRSFLDLVNISRLLLEKSAG